MQRGTHRNRVRVRVRSCCVEYTMKICGYYAKILQYVSEREAREMCDEDSHGNRLWEREPVAVRLSAKKAPLTDVRLLQPAKSEHNTSACLSAADSENNAFASAPNFRIAGPGQSIRALDRSMRKTEVWPEIYDDKAVVICAGKVHGVTFASI